MTKLDAIDKQLADLETTAADLEAQHSSLLEQIAAKFDQVNEKLTAEAAQIQARLASLPIARQTLRDQRDRLIRAQALTQYEKLCADMYARLQAADEMNADIQRAEQVVNDLRAQQAALTSEANDIQRRLFNMQRQYKNVLTPADTKRLDNSYTYVDLGYPNREQIMAKRAERGELPPDELPKKNGKGK